jgi:hypothetical protein
MTPVTIQQHIRHVLAEAAPAGLTMAALTGQITGPWRTNEIEAVVRKLWERNELARRPDGTFVALEGPETAGLGQQTRAGKPTETMDAAIRRLAQANRRNGYTTRVRTRTVDPGLLSAWCPTCRATVSPRLDGTCPTCTTQTGGNVEPPKRRRSRPRRRPLRKGQPGFGPVCPKCGGPKTLQAHNCRGCQPKKRGGRAGGKPLGATHISDEQLNEARRLYASSLSLRKVAAQLHPRTTYKTPASCAEGLYSLFKRRGWKLRPQVEVTRARNYKHGRKRRKQTRQEQNAYRHWLARQRGWKAIQGPGRPICKGVKTQPPGKGKPCQHHALEDSEYCFQHDPRYEQQRQTATAKMRARLPKQSMLPAAPFVAWLRAIHAELGSWKRVGEHIGLEATQANRWANGKGTNGEPLAQVSRRVVKRSATNAGTTIAAIYGAPASSASGGREQLAA